MKYELEECIGARLRALSRKVDSIFRKHLQGSNITANQLSIMMVLYKTGKIGQIEIGRILTLERSSLSRNLVRLNERGLILKEGAVNRPMISLSKTGVKQVDRLIPAWENAMNDIHQTIGEKAIHSFAEFEMGFN